MEARQPPQRQHEMAIRAWVILRPHGIAVLPVRGATEAETSADAGILRIHQARENVFRLFLIVGGKGKIVVFDSGILAERTLKCEQGAGNQRHAAGAPRRPHEEAPPHDLSIPQSVDSQKCCADPGPYGWAGANCLLAEG